MNSLHGSRVIVVVCGLLLIGLWVQAHESLIKGLVGI